MAITYVNPGEAVKSSTINEIIDIIGAEGNPSPDLGFTKTTKGYQFNVPTAYGSPNEQVRETYSLGFYKLSNDLALMFNGGTCVSSLVETFRDNRHAATIYPESVYQGYYDPEEQEEKVEALTDYNWSGGDKYPCTGYLRTKIRINGKTKTTLYYLAQFDENGVELTAESHYLLITDRDIDSMISILKESASIDNDVKSVWSTTLVERTQIKKNGQTYYGRFIQYHTGDIDISKSGEILTDSELSAIQLSSLQPHTETVGTGEEDDEGKEISSDETTYEIFGFHDKDNVVQYPVLSDYNMICRWKDPDSDKMIVKYLPISGDTTDTELERINQKSVEHRMDGNDLFLQLHDFDDGVVEKIEWNKDNSRFQYNEKDTEVLFRYDDGATKELKYGYLELSGISSVMSSIVSCIISNDISNFNSVSNFISSVVNNNISNFNNLSTYINNNISNWNNVSNFISNVVEVVLSGADLSGLGGISGDYNVLEKQKSIETKENDAKKKYHQLYRFDDSEYKDTHQQTIFHDFNNPIGCGDGFEFLVRSYQYDQDGNSNAVLTYRTLSVQQEHEKTDTTMSNNGQIYPRMYSINYNSGCSDNWLELFGFGALYSNSITPQTLHYDHENQHLDSLVIRRWSGCGQDHYIDYVGFDCISSFADYKGDSQLTAKDHLNPQQKSIQRNFDDLYGWYYGLYAWTGGNHSNNIIDAHCDGCYYDWGDNTKYDDDDTKYENYYFLVQHQHANGERELEYKRLIVKLPEIPENIESEVTNIWNNFENYWTISECSAIISGALSSLDENYWIKGESYEENYGVSIGDSNKNLAIWLDEHYLWGSWYVNEGLTCNGGDVLAWNFSTWDASGCFKTGNSYLDGCCLYVDGCACINHGLLINEDGLTVTGCSTFNDSLAVTYGVSIGCGYSGLTIGTTKLTEEDLIKLLSLVNGDKTAADKVDAL